MTKTPSVWSYDCLNDIQSLNNPTRQPALTIIQEPGVKKDSLEQVNDCYRISLVFSHYVLDHMFTKDQDGGSTVAKAEGQLREVQTHQFHNLGYIETVNKINLP